MEERRKRCRDCHEEKPLEDFPLQKGGRWGRHPLCKPCRAAQERARYARDRDRLLELKRVDKRWKRRARWRALERKYGLFQHEYEAIYIAQRGCCAICEVRFDRLFVDHCHMTSRVRGLLCSNCNFGIGDFADCYDRCVRAASYLRRRAPG